MKIGVQTIVGILLGLVCFFIYQYRFRSVVLKQLEPQLPLFPLTVDENIPTNPLPVPLALSLPLQQVSVNNVVRIADNAGGASVNVDTYKDEGVVAAGVSIAVPVSIEHKNIEPKFTTDTTLSTSISAEVKPPNDNDNTRTHRGTQSLSSGFTFSEADCQSMKTTYDVVPGFSWGTLPVDYQKKWDTSRCDRYISSITTGTGPQLMSPQDAVQHKKKREVDELAEDQGVDDVKGMCLV